GRINIIGNTKTRDTVVLRELTFNEGELLTTQKMDDSKRRVEGLGFFDQKEGVEWKINRVSDSQVDLDLIVKETRTGRGYGQLGYGGLDQDIQSPSATFNASAGIQDTNFRGTGLSYNASVTYSRQDIGFNLGLANPRLFDRPIGVGLDFFHRHSNYDEYKNVTNTPKELITGGLFTASFIPQFIIGSRFIFDIGAEHICYRNAIEARVPPNQKQFAKEFEQLTHRRFQPGTLAWLGATLIQDYRNHPVFPSKGYQWALYAKLGIPHGIDTFGFFKWEADAHWYTSLINDYNLILHLHGHVGVIAPMRCHTIPYRELFHIGGLSSVRGYLFGQIGPSVLGDSVGATKAFFINTELLFPITRDLSIRGVIFYDGGAGWDTPDAQSINTKLLKNNRFNYRHAIGFGIRLTNPAPIRVEVGFKLDRNRKRGECLSEVYFNTAAEF
ncbi:MAG TPA: BamA/TamA family outer membrane protein, partial [Candidatus Babeliaceae bacterium]|nr:BamA/TamA family outer membrane protein [Candidatus Babeliaceae bacterium]